MNKIMIDIETLDTRSTGVILSIGAVTFNETSIGHSFHRNIDIDSCLKLGMTVSGSTIAWWMEQPDAARKVFQKQGIHIVNVLDSFSRAFTWSKIEEVWANGTDFDLAMLTNAFDRTGLRRPWPYYKARDYRTARNMFPRELFDKVRFKPQVAHDALEDAQSQALTLQALLSSEHGKGRVAA
jgi:hypothetical protein